MALKSVEGIVLRTRNLGEADRIMTLYTLESGKMECVARGARRVRSRFTGGTQLFTHGQYILFSGRSLATLNQAEIVQSFASLREDLTKMAYASYFAELMDVFIELEEPGEELYYLNLNAFTALHDGIKGELLARWFEFNLMALLGYTPHLDGCVGCGEEVRGGLTMSFREGGVLCAGCSTHDATALRVERSTIEWLRRLLSTKADRLSVLRVSEHDLHVLEAVGRSYVDYRAPRSLKSLSFLSTIKKLA